MTDYKPLLQYKRIFSGDQDNREEDRKRKRQANSDHT